MRIRIGRFDFEGPYTDTGPLEDRAGIYAILCYGNGSYTVIDVGESAGVRSRVTNHERSACWSANCFGTLTVAVLYTPYVQQPGRMAIEAELRQLFAPRVACGCPTLHGRSTT